MQQYWDRRTENFVAAEDYVSDLCNKKVLLENSKQKAKTLAAPSNRCKRQVSERLQETKRISCPAQDFKQHWTTSRLIELSDKR